MHLQQFLVSPGPPNSRENQCAVGPVVSEVWGLQRPLVSVVVACAHAVTTRSMVVVETRSRTATEATVGRPEQPASSYTVVMRDLIDAWRLRRPTCKQLARCTTGGAAARLAWLWNAHSDSRPYHVPDLSTATLSRSTSRITISCSMC